MLGEYLVDFEIHEIWQVDSQENHYNFCHQMSDFRAKMHQKSISVGALPQTPLGNLQRSYRLSFGGPTSKGRGGETRGGEMTGREGKRRTTAIPNFFRP